MIKIHSIGASFLNKSHEKQRFHYSCLKLDKDVAHRFSFANCSCTTLLATFDADRHTTTRHTRFKRAAW
jgi:hypothetical protein